MPEHNWTKESPTCWRLLNGRWNVIKTDGTWDVFEWHRKSSGPYADLRNGKLVAERMMAAESLPEAATDPFQMEAE